MYSREILHAMHFTCLDACDCHLTGFPGVLDPEARTTKKAIRIGPNIIGI